MYSKLEIHQIYKNCDTMADLYKVSLRFRMLLKSASFMNAEYIQIQSLLRFRELVKNTSK